MTRLSEVRLSILESYSDPRSGAKLELGAWFHHGGRRYFGLDRVLPPHTGKGPAHVHLATEQLCVVTSGRARYRLGVRSGVLAEGEELLIPPGRAHVDPYNDGDTPLALRLLFSPGELPLLLYGRTLGHAIRDRRTNRHDEFRLRHLMVVLAQPDSDTYAAGVPVWLQRHLVIPLVAALGRVSGYHIAPGLRGRSVSPRTELVGAPPRGRPWPT